MTNFVQTRKDTKNRLCLVISLFLILLISYSSFISIRNSRELKYLNEHPVFYFIDDKFYGGEIFVNFDDGKYVTTKALTKDGKPKTHLKISPNNQKLGYFLDLNLYIDRTKNKEVNIDYDNHAALVVINKDGSDKKELYRGDYHTSHWEWLDDQTVRVYHSAGTGVETYRDIKINIPEPFIASTHMSPKYWTTIKMN